MRGVKFKICNDYTSITQQEQTDFIRKRHERGVRFIRLNRVSYLNQSVSYVMAAQTHRLHYRKESVEEVPRFSVDIERVLNAITYYYELDQREMSALEGLPHLSLTYEEVFEQPGGKQVAADQCFEFLGVESVPVDTAYRKPKRAKLPELIDNFDELAEALSRIPYVDINDVL